MTQLGVVWTLLTSNLKYMRSLTKYPSREQATLCYKNTCTTVYGETAQFVNAVIVTVTVVTAIGLIAKALK